MKRVKKHEYNKKLLLMSQVLLAGVSILLFSILFIQANGKQEDFAEILMKDQVFNILYLICMFDGICFFELWYFGKNFKENKNFESSLLSIVLIMITQLFLFDWIVTIILGLFIWKTLRVNNLSIRKVFCKARDNKQLIIPIANIVLFSLSVFMIYTMIIHRFM